MQVKIKIEEEFEALTAKLRKAITGYDTRLLAAIEEAKANVLGHVDDHLAPKTDAPPEEVKTEDPPETK